MRTLGFCIAGIVAALAMVDYGAAGNGGRLMGAALPSFPPEQAVVRERKGDRLPVAQGRQVNPVILDTPQPGPPPAKPQPTNHQPNLLKGCEPALSPLTGAALTGLHARCVADAGRPARLAALS